jgi:Uma2 family endonuclease
MSRAAPPISHPFEWSLDDVERLHLRYVSWELYEHLLKQTAHRRVKITYDNGELELMSPLPEHERPSRALCLLIMILTEELHTPFSALGGITLKRGQKKKGLEPDECFYIRNARRIRGKKRISLPKDPPPDLAIEIDVTRWSIPRLPIYAAMGVPEVWRYDGKPVQCLHLAKSGDYRPSERSLSFPMLRPADLTRFIQQAESADLLAAGSAFRKWVRKQGWSKSSS